MGKVLTFAGPQWWRRAWLAVSGRAHFSTFFLHSLHFSCVLSHPQSQLMTLYPISSRRLSEQEEDSHNFYHGSYGPTGVYSAFSSFLCIKCHVVIKGSLFHLCTRSYSLFPLAGSYMTAPVSFMSSASSISFFLFARSSP